MQKFPLVAIQSFIEATRDSGYKSTSSAIAELVDNAFEAEASKVKVTIDDDGVGKRMVVSDDGTGMPPNLLQLALQFGGSTRFNSRRGTGRYGMGLPNGSLSQARRVDVYSWTARGKVWGSYLDVDEIAAGKSDSVPPPVRIGLKTDEVPDTSSGTSVILTRCDRMTYRTIRAQAKRLHHDLGRIFREQLYAGKAIYINEEPVIPFDPLFLRHGTNLVGAKLYGPSLTYTVKPPIAPGVTKSRIVVRFALLPIKQWHSLSNEEKSKAWISKSAGVSVVRAGREIDYGWYFMGSKRKENYDDWWRCEVAFSPELDELFGVTHTKQKINPTESLNAILVPDMERIARDLNARVRKQYLAVREAEKSYKSEAVAERRDHLLQPLSIRNASEGGEVGKNGTRLNYVIEDAVTNALSFYDPALKRDHLTIVLNREHSFFKRVYQPLLKADRPDIRLALEHLQLMLLAAGRAECAIRSRKDKETAERFRRAWSNTLTAFLD